MTSFTWKDYVTASLIALGFYVLLTAALILASPQ
jgi:hypothetical protein